jgi:hypothetical protein
VLIFSDAEQTFQGLQVHDALDELERKIGNDSDPNSMYHRKLRGSAQNLNLEDKDRLTAWKLDRFKNMPMLIKSYRMKPAAKWFIFIDADTYVLWANLLTWLSQLDSNRPLYLGSQVNRTVSENLVFAHGGSGYVISRAAASILAEESQEQADRHFNLTKADCCGDAALGIAFRDHGLLLTKSWPAIQGKNLPGLGYDLDYWCFAAITFHHMQSDDILAMYAFENSPARPYVSTV